MREEGLDKFCIITLMYFFGLSTNCFVSEVSRLCSHSIHTLYLNCGGVYTDISNVPVKQSAPRLG